MSDDETFNNLNQATAAGAASIIDQRTPAVFDFNAIRGVISPGEAAGDRDSELDRLIDAAEAAGNVVDDTREEAETLFYAARKTNPSLNDIDKEMLPGHIGALYRTAERCHSEWLALDRRIENWRPSSVVYLK